MNPTPDTIKQARRILDLTSHEFNGERYGNDTVVGTDEGLINEVALALQSAREEGAKDARIACGCDKCLKPL